MAVRDRDDLFAGWRLFFERMADRQPTILVLEDMQWADAALLEFVEHLLEWSRNHPLFVLALARPELGEKHPGWAAGKRNFTALHLDALGDDSMRELLHGLVPGLSEDLTRTILDRAEGVPLYAVETVRMLLDRGLLEADGTTYRSTGPVESLDVPETLQALVSARLDGLDPSERRAVQVAAVLGKTFAKGSLTALANLDDDTADALLGGLVRKDVLTLQADPRSPERGQYGFVQDLLKLVAYETLSRGDRKALHLAAADHLERTWSAAEHEIVEVVASHLVDAYRAVPGADDADALSDRAREMLERAGERAASLAAAEEARRYFEQAGELTSDPLVCGRLYERAGQMAWLAGHGDATASHYGRAIQLLESAGESHAAARVSARLGEVDWASGRLDEALERMESALTVLERDEPDEALAALTAQMARLRFFRGDTEGADEMVERALDIAESLWLPEVLAQALITAGLVALRRARPEQSIALTRHGLALALEHDLASAALRAYNNLGNLLGMRDRYDEAIELQGEAVSLARKVGSRIDSWRLGMELAYSLARTGRWDDALAADAAVPSREAAEVGVPPTVPDILGARGLVDEARARLALLGTDADSADVQARAFYLMEETAVRRAEGRAQDALTSALECLASREDLGLASEIVKQVLVEGVEAALELGDDAKAEELLAVADELRPGELPPSLGAQVARFRSRLAARRGDRDAVEPGFKSAAGIFREFGLRFWLAVTLLEHGEWLASDGRLDEAAPLVAEAREIFDDLRAVVWLDRVERITGAAGIAA
jgi:tetratricopeptide (TPR) repeat protein